MNIKSLLARCCAVLAGCGGPSPRLDCEVLLMHMLKADRVLFLSHPEQEITDEQTAAFEIMVARRKKGEPVSYIVGKKEFWSLDFAVTPAVLIPRPETECLVEEVLAVYSFPGDGLSICDIGTGSGIIAVVLARELPLARITATDISAEALLVAQKNAGFHGVSGNIAFRQTDILDGDSGLFDVICSNPPYIADESYELLPEGIRDFEPREALAAGINGLDIYRKIIKKGSRRLKKGGRIFFEIGEDQSKPVTAMLMEDGAYRDIRCRRDYEKQKRVLSAVKE